MKSLRVDSKPSSLVKCLWACLLAGLWLLMAPSSIYAGTIIVDTPADENDHSCSDGDCSLRDAVELAAAGDTINFTGTMTVYLSSQLNITRNLTIDGGAYTVTVSGDTGGDGSTNVRVFNIGAGSNVTLTHLQITKGVADKGGGIYNAGTLTVQECRLFSNLATTGSAGGGAVWNESGVLKVISSTISGNHADDNGGGILNRYNTVTVQNSTIANNSASLGTGGGIDSINGTIVLKNSTLSGNSAGSNGGGGLYHWGGTVSIYNTIIANSGNGDCTFIAGPTVAANINNLVEDGSCSTNGVGFVSGDPSLGPLTDNGGRTLSMALLPASWAIDGGNNATCLSTDQRGVARPQMARCDIGAYEAAPQPVLRLTQSVTPTGGIAYAGGMVTYTIVVSNSTTQSDPQVWLTDTLPLGMNFKQWVINSGGTFSNNQLTWNGTLGSQAILTFTFQATHSAGLNVINTVMVSDAIQLVQASSTFTSFCQNGLTVTNGNDVGPGSLRQAMIDSCDGGSITYAGNITTYLNSQLDIGKRLTIDGGPYSATVSGDSGNDGSRNVRAFNISAGSVVTLAHLNITQCYNSDRGSGANNFGTLTVIGCNFSNNAGDFGGAAINSNEGSLTVRDSTFTNNSGAYGGAINVFRGTMFIQTSAFTNNSALNGGGAIDYYRLPSDLDPNPMTILTSTFSGNSSWYGGAIEIQNIPLTIGNCVFTRNTARSTGGAIFYDVHNYAGTVRNITIDNSTFAENVAAQEQGSIAWGGGGIYNYLGAMTIRNSTFFSNSSRLTDGGAIHSGYSLSLLNSTLIGNSSGVSDYVGGLFNNGGLNIQNTIIAGSGPGADCRAIGTSSVTNINNLIEDGSCSADGVNFFSGDPEVGPPADNGGGFLTHALLPGSRAIDSGSGCLATDQRGVARPQGGACDRGALEMPAQPILQLTHSVAPATEVPLHGMVTYTLTLTNRGTVTDSSVLLTDTLPAEVLFDSWVISPSNTVRAGNSFTWTGVLTPGRVLTWTFSAAHTGSLYGQVVTNVGWISGTIQHNSKSTVFQVQPVYTLTVRSTGNGGGSVGSEPSGITCGTVCAAGYPSGTVVTLTATPGVSSTFAGWSGDQVGTTSPMTVVMNAVRNLTATFNVKSFTITPTAGLHGAILPGTPQAVLYGNALTFTVTPTTGYHIADVEVDGVSQGAIGSYTFNNVTANHTITAAFAINICTLSTTVVGQGQVTRVPDRTMYDYGTVVTLTAVPTTGWHFGHWSGDLSGVLTQTPLSMEGNKAVTATFAVNTYIITPTAGAHGSFSPATPQTVNYGDTITFTVTPTTGYHIVDVGVDGVSQGAVAVYTFTNVTADHFITAAFEINSYTLDMAIVGQGQVSRVPSQTTYLHGSVVTLTATPTTGWYFGQWSGGASGIATQTTVVMDSHKTVTATFLNAPAVYYTLTVGLSGSGSVTPGVGTHNYLSGTVVDLSAGPAEGWIFAGWTGAVTGTTPAAQITMDGDKAITAVFRVQLFLPVVMRKG